MPDIGYNSISGLVYEPRQHGRVGTRDCRVGTYLLPILAASKHRDCHANTGGIEILFANAALI